MHGRLKVRTTAEQAERKAKERLEKLTKYRAALKIVFQKRQDQELDDEALALSAKLLAANSDLYTLWNFRKEILLKFKQESVSDEALQKLFDTELHFTEECLRSNPKSYGCWEQRCFAMLHAPRPAWARELALCAQFLQYDERNFHCWDYRRFVVRHSHVTAADELSFTTDKISSNFSNFSSWHYRSSLLPCVHPAAETIGHVRVTGAAPSSTEQSGNSTAASVHPDKLQEEFEMVQNAFFTDPSDQSAWFYHRWLMAAGERADSELLCCVLLSATSLCFSAPKARKLSLTDVRVSCNGALLPVTSMTCTAASGAVWSVSLGEPLASGSSVVLQVAGSRAELSGLSSWMAANCTPQELLAEEKRAFLQQQYDAVVELQELEPDNKWILLALVSLCRALNLVNDGALRHIDRLMSLDPMRRNYYTDLKSRLLVESRLPVKSDDLDLSGLGLSYVAAPQYLLHVTSLNVSNNSLSSLDAVGSLLSLQRLDASHNRIRSCGAVSQLLQLQHIDLSHNELDDSASLKALKKLPSLQTMKLENNPVVSQRQ